ncbi:hypothetical protein WEN_01870 [Mycoplasma wenyonii str. Massachusetts]|uniref:Uncharacterized protein n=1 Tax=Mycoplasma wenyonii (strain Massachusetts) TaxID=1197325 RepID=I6ZEY4_MYCWM|nr:hypothetical protein [Mycoplasma wenyonii]AFN65167.1 hypothetical protein WEN_01870 [Mycoplasma wenyonii str. Massachusetts]
MPSKLGHLVKLVPVAIGGTYSAYPSFLPTQPKDIKGLLNERKCYIVTQSKKETGGSSSNKAKYLFACTTDPVGKTLDFFYFDSSRRVAVPVKHLKESRSGGGNEEKQINLGFTWGGSTSLQILNIPLFEINGVSTKDLYLTDLCKGTEIQVLAERAEILKCTGVGEDGQSKEYYWKRGIGKKQKQNKKLFKGE